MSLRPFASKSCCALRVEKMSWAKDGKDGAALRTVTYYRGHTKTQMTWEVVKVEKAIQPGDAGYYIIHLGKRIK